MSVLNFVFGSTIGQVIVIAITTGVIWIGSGWLEDSAETLSQYYGLPEVVQGSIVVAIGSSFPELASVVVTALSGSFGMGVGAIVGSAIANILVIPGLSGLASDEELDANRTLVYKEAQFYMIAVAALLITFSLAVIYFPVSGREGELVGTVSRSLAIIPLALYALYIFIQWQDVSDHDAGDTSIDGSITRQWGLLIAGLGSILVAVESLVRAVEGLNATFGIPEFIAGILIISVVTSLPDTLVSVRAARSGKGVASIGNVLGSNTFDLLVAIPIGVLIVGDVAVSFSLAAPMMGVLTLATVLLFTVLRTGLQLTTVESYVLLGAYGVFAVWVVAETIGVVNVLAATPS